MNFRQLPLSLSSLFSFTVFTSLSIFPSYPFTPISDLLDITSQAPTFVISNVVPILYRHSCLPLLLATFIFLPPLCHSHFSGLTVAAASHSNENGGETETPQTRSLSADCLNSNSLLSSAFFPQYLSEVPHSFS